MAKATTSKPKTKAVKKKTAGRPKSPSASGGTHSLETIVNVARRHFAQFGYQGVNLKDVAKESNVANSLLTYHFKGKEGLYRTCIEGFARDRMESINRLLKDPETVEELRLRLTIFVEEMLLSYINDPETFKVINREMHSNNPISIQIFEETFLKSFFNVAEFFARAKKRGLISKNFDPHMIASFLFCVTCDNAQKDELAKRYLNQSLSDASWRKRMSDQIVELFMSGVIK